MIPSLPSDYKEIESHALVRIDVIEQLDVVNDNLSEFVPLLVCDVVMEEVLFLKCRHVLVPQVFHREVSLGYVDGLTIPFRGPRFVEVLSKMVNFGF